MKVQLINYPINSNENISPEYKKFGKYKVAHAGPSQFMEVSLPPIGLMTLAPHLMNAGHDVNILDAATLELTMGDTIEEIKKYKPDILGVSIYYHNFRDVYTLTGKVKKIMDIPIILGGPQASGMPEKTLDEFKDVDAIMRGWGEFSIVQMIDYVVNGKGNPDEILGLGIRDNGGYRLAPLATLPKDLDDLPKPNRSLLEQEYKHHIYFNVLSRRKNMDILVTSRNCPFACKFCYNVSGHGHYTHTPERVIEDIRELVDRGVDAIEIMDELFTARRKRVDRILDLLEKENFDLEFRIRSRVDHVDQDLLNRLKKAGTRAISFGMESGVDRVLGIMNKKTTAAQNEAACRMAKKAGLIVHSSWVMGHPGETDEERERTFQFIRRIKPTTFNVNILIPTPDTQYFKEAVEDGSIVGEWSVHEPNNPYIAPTGDYKDINEFTRVVHKRVFQEYRNWKFVLRTLKLVLLPPNMRLLKLGLKMFFTSSIGR